MKRKNLNPSILSNYSVNSDYSDDDNEMEIESVMSRPASPLVMENFEFTDIKPITVRRCREEGSCEMCRNLAPTNKCVRLLNCSHKFHPVCIKKEIRETGRRECPICKKTANKKTSKAKKRKLLQGLKKVKKAKRSKKKSKYTLKI
jgi:hypothetical protein